MTLEEQAEATEKLARAIAATIGTDDVMVIMGGLGAVAGAVALASGDTEKCLSLMVAVARGVIRKKLLD